MAELEEYRRKRDFGVTPEPPGVRGEPHAGLSYVIQKHAASRLHWDFRIELDGVLLSWAVPKGPSLDPADKRLAMRVEDHPIDYGSFEGAIPEGEYGGGTVMLWDRGTWEPDHGDPRQHLAEGHLKFHLYGSRLRGRWMLVKTKGYGGKGAENSWLLFKERDEEARPKPGFDAVAEWTTSVATHRTMEQIAADPEAMWHSDDSNVENVVESHEPQPPTGGRKGRSSSELAGTVAALSRVAGARQAKMPRSLDVELATLVKQVPEGDRWLHEIKFDGYRMLAFMESGKVRLLSRNGQDWTDRFKEIASAVAALPASDALLDGEVVVVRPDGTNDFGALQNYARRGQSAQLHYMAFDLLHLDGYDLRGVALDQRKRLLFELLPRHDDRVRYTDHIEGHGDAFLNHACEYSLEGAVSKRRDSPYRSGRGRDWLKTKCLLRQEFVVVGYTDPGGGRSAFGALVLALREGSDLVHVGRVGTGFTEESLADLSARLKGTEVSEPPVTNPPTGPSAKGIHWVEPSLVAEVSFAEWTEDRVLRHPSYQGLREDKSPEEVFAESPADVSPIAEYSAEREPPEDETPAIAGVALSNPSRVFWPEAGVTKLDLARYYENVAEHMLPHVIDRPLSLVRCPRGHTEECFYQKHAENFPSVVGTVQIADAEAGGPVPYARVTGLPSIIGLVQMGVLEIHTWGARIDDLERPDRLVFDLDPDSSVPWSTVSATARLLRSELARTGLDSWVKTTGGKGLHVVVPLVRRQGWDDVRAFSRAFVDSVVALEPQLFTASMSKSQRSGRIFIDYLRNARGATAVAPYSTRARPNAPVSVPLQWNELEAADSNLMFTMSDVVGRLESIGADPWADLLSCRQSITKAMRRRLGIG